MIMNMSCRSAHKQYGSSGGRALTMIIPRSDIHPSSAVWSAVFQGTGLPAKCPRNAHYKLNIRQWRRGWIRPTFHGLPN